MSPPWSLARLVCVWEFDLVCSDMMHWLVFIQDEMKF